MKLTVKDMDVASGGPLIAIVNHEDASKIDLHEMDRIKIIKGKKIETAFIDIAKSRKTVPRGYIGLFEEVIKSLNLRNGNVVSIKLAKKPLSLEHIKRKMDGEILTKKEIDQIVWDIVHNRLSDIETTYFVAACYTNVLTIEETIYLIKSMVKYGEVLKLKKYPVVDKHCIGGVPGNRTTLVLVPIIAAAGYTMPKTSSRSITSPAGSADTMEVLADVALGMKEMKETVQKTNACIVWGGSLNLAPADDKIIKVEKPLDMDAESQLVASIMAKKYSVSSTHILLDIPVGDDVKAKNEIEAERLKRNFTIIGKRLGKKIKVILTDGSQPVGNGIGPALEARDVLWVLKRDPRRPLDLEKKCLHMASCTFKMLGMSNGYEIAREILDSGRAFKKMKEIIKAQGGKSPDPDKIKLGQYQHTFLSNKSGRVEEIDNIAVSRIARIAGAPLHKGAGMYIYKHIGDKVKKREKLFTIYAESRIKLKYAIEVAKSNGVYCVK